MNLGGDELLMSAVSMQNLLFLNSFQLDYPENIQKFCLKIFSFLTSDLIYDKTAPKIMPYFNATADIVENKNFEMIGLSSNHLILNMSTQFILLFMLQPVLIVTILVLRVFLPRVKRVQGYFQDYFWNGLIGAINSNTQISLICALITIFYYFDKKGDE